MSIFTTMLIKGNCGRGNEVNQLITVLPLILINVSLSNKLWLVGGEGKFDLVKSIVFRE